MALINVISRIILIVMTSSCVPNPFRPILDEQESFRDAIKPMLGKKEVTWGLDITAL